MSKQSADAYFAKEFCIVDDQGKTKGRFLTHPDGRPALELYDEQRESARVMATVYPDGRAGIALSDDVGLRLVIEVSPGEGTPTLHFFGKDGGESVDLKVDVGETTRLLITDKKKRSRVSVSIHETSTDMHDDDTRLVLRDVDGEEIFDTIEPVPGSR